ncbi:tRNA-specific adenosine deaminase 1 [Hordeum vulgare]|nr:tRNA-specific adenosine deaminase 1 [Hordeum vulgare]
MAVPASPGDDMDVEVAAFLASCAASEYGAAEALLDRLDAPASYAAARRLLEAVRRRLADPAAGQDCLRRAFNFRIIPDDPRLQQQGTSFSGCVLRFFFIFTKCHQERYLEQALMLGCVGADVTASSRKSSWVNLTSQDTERPDLANAHVVVTGGTGLNSAENFKLLAQLAEKLGAAGLHDRSYFRNNSEETRHIFKAASLPSTVSLLCKIRLAEAFISLEHPLATKFCHEKIAYRAIKDMACEYQQMLELLRKAPFFGRWRAKPGSVDSFTVSR